MIYLAFIFIGAQTQAYPGHDQGSGGGGFCIEEKCKTLAEAGFKLKEEDITEPLITKEITTALKEILTKVSVDDEEMKNSLAEISLGRVSQFVRVEIVDKDRFAQAKEEYLEILRRNNFPTENFELFAFTDFSKKITYILPAFYKLDAASKAKILIHEGIIRLNGVLSDALKMDIAVENTLTGKSEIATVARIYINLFKRETFGLPIAAYFRDYINTHGRPLSGNELFKRSQWIDLESSDDAADIFAADPSFWKVLKINNINKFHAAYQDITRFSKSEREYLTSVCLPYAEREAVFINLKAIPYRLGCQENKVSWLDWISFYRAENR